MIRLLRVRFLLSFLKTVFIKIRYWKNIEVNPFKVYISPSAIIKITSGGKLIIKSKTGRVYISRHSTIHCSSGTLTIGNGVFFNENNKLVCHNSIEIGDDCLFGPNVCVYDSDHAFSDHNALIRDQGYTMKEIILDKDVWVGAGSVITKGSIVGSHTVIGACTVVRGELKRNCVYAGNPVRLIKEIT